jgi:hypothetical protein
VIGSAVVFGPSEPGTALELAQRALVDQENLGDWNGYPVRGNNLRLEGKTSRL